MEILSGAAMVIKSLINQGIQHIFGYPGGAVLDIYDALKTIGGIKHILVRHEQAATHMADGYARSTGKVGVVLVTSGPGATNAITGIATAYMDSIPMVVISGQVSSSLIGYDAFQECDMIGISRPIVKHSFLVNKTEDIPNTFKKAFWLASSGRPGPVVIDLPKDILQKKYKYHNKLSRKICIRSYNPTTQGHIGQIKKALNTLMQSKKPVIYAGGGIISSECHKELRFFAEKTHCPVTTSLMGLGGFPGNHSQSISMLGMHGTYEANMAMHYADLIFAIGVRFDDRTTNNLEKYCPNAKIVHIDIDPTSISKTVKADIPIVGDAKSILTKMLELFEQEKNWPSLKDWWLNIKKWRHVDSLKYDKNKTMIQPQAVIQTLFKLTNGNAYITSDVGQHQMFTALYYPFSKPHQTHPTQDRKSVV